MGLLDLYSGTAGINEPAVQTVTRTLGERVEATAAETFAPDRYFNQNARRDAWQRAVDELHLVTGEALPNPYGAVTSDEMMRLGNQPAVEGERRTRIIEAYRLARETDPDRFQSDPESIDQQIGEESTRRRQVAASYEGTGNGFLNFLASAALETATPHGLVGLMVPVSKLPTAAASAVGRTFLGNVLREAGLQAGANAGLQVAAEGLDYLSRSETGTAQNLGEILTNVAGAGVIGAALGGGVRTLHLKWLGLPESVRANAPLEVRDAFHVIEADALYSGKNRLGIDALLHERYVEQSMDPILRGRPVDFSNPSRSVDTPFTALGTILRSDQAGVRGLEGLGTAMDRVRALPDRELEGFARELAPRPFERLDAVQSELAQARRALDEINSRTPAAGDLLDPETAMRLQDIERDLSTPALSRKQRIALEDEREMIMASVDPGDRLPKQAAKAQRLEAETIQKQIDKLETKHAELAPKAELAVADLRRKLDRYAFAPGFEWAGKSDQPWSGPKIAQDLGFKAPADLDGAIARADLLRQTRLVREWLPDGITQPQVRVGNVSPEGAAKEITPDMQRALDTEAARVIDTRPDIEVEIGGRTMTARQAMDDADRQAKDAQAALGCAMGSL